MKPTILKYEEAKPYLDEIITNADNNRVSFGFICKSAYPESMEKGFLWVLTLDEVYVGHLLFGGKYPSLKIFQIYINPRYHKKGYGKFLIEKFITYSKNLHVQIISVKVAAELPANTFWINCGFLFFNQEEGHGNRRLVNKYLYEVDKNQLFENAGAEEIIPLSKLKNDKSPISTVPIYAIDLNVFFDYLKDRENCVYITNLISMAMSGHVRIVITAEFIDELKRNSIGEDPVLRFAEQFKRLPEVDVNQHQELYNNIYNLIFPEKRDKTKVNDKSDVSHIVASIVNEIDGFITSEKKILRQSEHIFKNYKLQILSPYELYSEDGEINSHAIDLDSEEINLEILQKPFNNNSNPFIELLSPRALTEIKQSDYEYIHSVNVSENCMGVIGIQRVQQRVCLINALLLLDDSAPNIYLLIDKCMDFIYEYAAKKEYCQLCIKVKKDSDVMIQTLQDQLFLRSNTNHEFFSEYVRLFVNKQIFRQDWEHLNSILEYSLNLKGPNHFPSYDEMINSRIVFSKSNMKKYGINLFDFETFFYPTILMCSKRPGVIIPIHKNFIEAFFPKHISQDDLFPHHSASVSCEKVYYRAPKKSTHLEKGKLAFFYESGFKGGAKKIIGYGRITSSQIVDIDVLNNKFYRQGVLSEISIEGLATNGKIQVITFSNFRIFKHPVSYNLLEKEKIVTGARLVTAQGIDFKDVNKIMKYGNNGA